jgi:hypothetical protein
MIASRVLVGLASGLSRQGQALAGDASAALRAAFATSTTVNGVPVEVRTKADDNFMLAPCMDLAMGFSRPVQALGTHKSHTLLLSHRAADCHDSGAQ